MNEFIDHVLEQLSGLGELHARKMFGGVGLYCDGLFFALIGRGALYMKVDDSNRPDYEARGSEPFRPDPERPQSMSYYELPVEVLEQREQAIAWARLSVEAARRAKSGKRARSSRSSSARRRPAHEMPDSSASSPVGSLRNLGPASVAWLQEVGVETRADLEGLGSVGAYRAVEARRESVSLNFLYALEAALLDVHWTRLPAPLRKRLREAVGR